MGKKSRPRNTNGRKRRTTSAPDSYRGFSLQATRLLHYLLAADPPEFVSLEVLDDVSVTRRDGTRVAEQDKSYLASNPLADRAEALWKTLRNWVDAAEAGALAPDRTRFVLYAPKAQPGQLAQLLVTAKNPTTIAAAIEQLRALGDEAGNAAWQPHARAILAADRTALSQIIGHLEIDTPAGSPSDTLPPLFAAKLISPECLDDSIKWAHGWVKDTIDSLLEKSEPACICYQHFHDALRTFVKHHDRLVFLQSYAGTPEVADVNHHLAFRCYVRQLRIIDLEHVDVLEAVNDYLRSSVDRTEWARRGFITETSLDAFEHELEITWRNKKLKVTLGHSTATPEQIGQLLYAECMDHSLALDGLPTPPAFLRGSLHSIADDCKIGWHPNYAMLLATPPETEAAT